MKSSLYAVDYTLPKQVIKTSELMEAANTQRFGISNKLIEKALGIKEVRHAEESRSSVDLAVEAAEKNFAHAPIKREDIDMIIYTGIEGAYVEPSTAHFIQHRLNIKKAIAFDISNACIGFITALQIAHWAIQSGQIRYALICTGETPSRVSKKMIANLQKTKDKDFVKSRLGFLTVGDAGGSVILGPSENDRGILGFNTASYGQYANLCYYKYNADMSVEGLMEMEKITNASITCHNDLYPSSLSLFDCKKKDISVLILRKSS